MTDDLDQAALRPRISRPTREGPALFSSARIQARSASRHAGLAQFMAAYEAALSARASADWAEAQGGHYRRSGRGLLQLGLFRESETVARNGVYRLVLDKFAREDGHRLVRDMPRHVAMSIIEEIGATRPGMANLTLR